MIKGEIDNVILVGNGRNNNRWSTITYQMALAVFCRSPAAYEALSGFSILKLPSQESLKHLRSGYFQADGPNWENLEESAEDYIISPSKRKKETMV